MNQQCLISDIITTVDEGSVCSSLSHTVTCGEIQKLLCLRAIKHYSYLKTKGKLTNLTFVRVTNFQILRARFLSRHNGVKLNKG